MAPQFAAGCCAALYAVAGWTSAFAGEFRSTGARIEVDYSDTFQGQSAVLAVRACVDSEATSGTPASNLAVASPLPLAPAIDVRQLDVDVDKDVIVRVFDHNGVEVSRHEGATNVCGFARVAAAYVLRAGEEGTR